MGVVIRQSIKGTIVNYLGVAIGFVTTFFVLTRCLNPAEVGLTRVMIDAATLFAGLAQMGTGSSVMRFFPYFRDPETKHHGFFFWTLAVPLVGFLIFGALFLLLRDPICASFTEKSPLFANYWYFVLPMGFFLLYMTVFEVNSNVLQRIAVPKLIREVGVRVMMLAIYILYGTGVLTINGMLLCFCGMYAVATLLNVIYLISLGGVSFKPDFNHITATLRSEYLFYTLFLVIAALGSVITPLVNTFFVTAKLGLDSTGILAIATYVAAVVEMPYRSLGAISQPILAQSMKERDRVKTEEMTKSVSLHQLIVGGFIFFVIWINIDLFFDLLPNGGQYEAAKPVVFVLGLSKLIQSTLSISGSVLTYSRKYYWSLFFTLFLTALAIVLNNTLIPIMGINGAALATLASYLVYYAMIIIFVKVKTGTILFSWQQLLVIALIALMFALNLLFSHYVTPVILSLAPDSVLLAIGEAIVRTGVICIAGVAIGYVLNISEEVNRLVRIALGKEKTEKQ